MTTESFLSAYKEYIMCQQKIQIKVVDVKKYAYNLDKDVIYTGVLSADNNGIRKCDSSFLHTIC